MYTPRVLSKLTKFALVIEDLDKDSTACGITTKLVHDAFTKSAESAGFEILEVNESRAAFYIQINTVRPNGICISSINFELFYIEIVRLDFSREEEKVEISLWRDSWLGRATANQIRKVIEDKIRAFVIHWKLANN